MSQHTLQQQRTRRLHRLRAMIRGTAERPRLAVHRSLRHISAQVIDDVAKKTIAAASDRDLPKAEQTGKKTEVATRVGKLIGERAKAEKITQVVFDRRDKRYHGRVRAVAEGAREAGLAF